MPRSGPSGVRKAAPAKKPRKKTPSVTAHAGSLGTPPNSRESFLRALAFPVDYLEADVRFTSTGEAYLSHDRLPPARQRGAMRLKDLLALVARRPRVRLNLDMKEVTGLAEMVRLLKRAGMASRVVMTGLSGDALRAAREKGGGLPYLYNHAPGFLQRFTARGAAALARAVRENGARGLNTHHAFVTRKVARAMADAGLELSVWTVDGERGMHRMLRLGAHNITTNRVDVLLDLRGGRQR
jgi:glycerophosphoryl diester phosphodiesterase